MLVCSTQDARTPFVFNFCDFEFVIGFRNEFSFQLAIVLKLKRFLELKEITQHNQVHSSATVC